MLSYLSNLLIFTMAGSAIYEADTDDVDSSELSRIDSLYVIFLYIGGTLARLVGTSL